MLSFSIFLLPVQKASRYNMALKSSSFVEGILHLPMIINSKCRQRLLFSNPPTFCLEREMVCDAIASCCLGDPTFITGQLLSLLSLPEPVTPLFLPEVLIPLFR